MAEKNEDIVYTPNKDGGSVDVVIYLRGDPAHDSDTFIAFGKWLAEPAQKLLTAVSVLEHGPRKLKFRVSKLVGQSRDTPCHYVSLDGLACHCGDFKPGGQYGNCK